jgi:hypothetical protein
MSCWRGRRAICGQPQKGFAAGRREETKPEGSPARCPDGRPFPLPKAGRLQTGSTRLGRSVLNLAPVQVEPAPWCRPARRLEPYSSAALHIKFAGMIRIAITITRAAFAAMRGPGESYSDAILRLVELETKGRP